jgi:hypothetical protein
MSLLKNSNHYFKMLNFLGALPELARDYNIRLRFVKPLADQHAEYPEISVQYAQMTTLSPPKY